MTQQFQTFFTTSRVLYLQIERERSKERLENKRRQDQLKKVFDEEKEENKKKLSEVTEGLILNRNILWMFWKYVKKLSNSLSLNHN